MVVTTRGGGDCGDGECTIRPDDDDDGDINGGGGGGLTEVWSEIVLRTYSIVGRTWRIDGGRKGDIKGHVVVFKFFLSYCLISSK